ncbi:MAG: alpha-amylase family glycosyl hydrolase [Tissierellaceae bacterium]|nr:alpha-amylase family glycosyl hydrolase [Tissierellaceae bacterium]
MIEKLKFLYGVDSSWIKKEIETLAKDYGIGYHKKAKGLTEKDSVLITYGDSIINCGERPLQTLKKFADDRIKDAIEAIHILPFYPYSSDDGFSVIDYEKVDPNLGTWEDIGEFNHDLMFDGVINHISKESLWFQEYINGNPKFQDYFIESDPGLSYSKVVRPRALPLLTSFQVNGQQKYIWTTFSEDQIDLNYENPKVFLTIVEVLLKYIKKGARFIRLDAIGFAWKRIGTSCIHLEETHVLVQLLREILTMANPEVIIITETNVPHKENISYFGNGHNEAHMVYQFPLPPLTLHTFISENSEKLSQWAKSLERISDETTYFNFLASHDGIGLRPVEEILTVGEIDAMVHKVVDNGGLISYRDNGDGTKSPYELNINFMDALNDNLDENILIDKFIAASAILYSMVGVPAVYIHSLLGSWNYHEGVENSGVFRRINREKLNYDELLLELESKPRRKQVFEKNLQLLNIRKNERAFHPYGYQEVIENDPRLFILRRISPEKKESILVIVNISTEEVPYTAGGRELIDGQTLRGEMILKPYGVKWIKEQAT